MNTLSTLKDAALNRSWPLWLVALLAGFTLPFSLAPYNHWYLGIICASILWLLIRDSNTKTGTQRAFFFGVGLYAKGASWVYVAIHDFGFTTSWLALVMTSIFVLGLAVVFALPFSLYCRYLPRSRSASLLGFSAIWVLGEWTRSWFLTGFPWLYLGYAHVDTWLSGWAPMLGVFGLSFFALLSGVIALNTIHDFFVRKEYRTSRLIPVISVGVVWLSGLYLGNIDWRENNNRRTMSVAFIQPNVTLAQKWNPLYLTDNLNILRELSASHWDKDLIVWPEAAIPMMYHDAHAFLQEIHEQAVATDTGLITGILYDDKTPGVFYNSILGLGRAEGIYFKQRLVPFGEYVPLEKWLRGLIAFFDLPNSVIFPGPSDQNILSFEGQQIAPSICYEIVYPDLVAETARDASMLITISNDAWFGKSIGPVQHFQMAQMRALENQLYVVRSTNTGISGIIDPKGQVTLMGKQFSRESQVQDNIDLRPANTPFSRFKSWPVIIILMLIVTILTVREIREQRLRAIKLSD